MIVPGSINPGMLGGGYQIANSVRFRSSNSAYLSRTFGAPTSNTTWTYSSWIKKSSIGVTLGGFGHATGLGHIGFESTDQIRFWDNTGASAATSAAVYRDPTAHGHFFVRSNGTNIKAYWNNVEVLSYTGTITNINSNGTGHAIGRFNGIYYTDGYLSDIYFVDGQALTPSDFGETNAEGVWVPKAYAGTYGNNGFYLLFDNGNSTTTLGYDKVGTNHWTLNGMTRVAGVDECWMTDTPTNNYATISPLFNSGGTRSLTDANLRITGGGTAFNSTEQLLVFVPSSGKWYFEYVINSTAANETRTEFSTAGYAYNGTSDGSTAYGSSQTINDVVGCAIDQNAGQVTFYKNNIPQGTQSITAGVERTIVQVLVGLTASPPSNYYNFGQRAFSYTPPAGFKSLCTANLPAVTVTNPAKHFDVKLHTGNAGSQTITGVGFQPDFAWIKSRNAAHSYGLWDSIRGVYKRLVSDLTGAEENLTDTVTAFNADGISVGANTVVNGSTVTFVDWLWKANGAGVTNTAGSITSTVSANTTAGFSIVTYTGTGANATVGHGLGVAPKFYIVKQRSAGAASWWGWHSGLTSGAYKISLNNTDAQTFDATAWNSTAPSSSVFSIGTSAPINTNTSTYVAYCFAEIPGYSKFGSYVGNGSTDGPFVYCGFRPKWLLIKSSSIGGAGYSWLVYDSARDSYNIATYLLQPNLADAESPSSAAIDVTANGFKLRTTGLAWNQSTQTFIFAAFAEHPTGGANVSPAPAR